MQTLAVKHLVQVVSHEEVISKVELPAYFKDSVTGAVSAIAEDKRIVQISSMRRYYSLTIFEPGDDQYDFKLKELTGTARVKLTTEEHFFNQLARLKNMLP
jgi:hypothetical protein